MDGPFPSVFVPCSVFLLARLFRVSAFPVSVFRVSVLAGAVLTLSPLALCLRDLSTYAYALLTFSLP